MARGTDAREGCGPGSESRRITSPVDTYLLVAIEKNNGTSQSLLVKPTISTGPFSIAILVPEGTYNWKPLAALPSSNGNSLLLKMAIHGEFSQ